MPNILTRIFGYSMLLERLADRDAQIVSLKVEVQELRDRLYIKHGLAPSGAPVAVTGAVIPPYRTGRQRLKDMVTPQISSLSPDEERMIEESITQ